MDLSTALWAELKTDADRARWLLLGRGYETGVVAHAVQADLAMAYHRLALTSGVPEFDPGLGKDYKAQSAPKPDADGVEGRKP